MTTNQTLSEYIRALKSVERRLRQIERKLRETDDKLDHIIFRLMEEDPRVFHQLGVIGSNGENDGVCNGNNSHGDENSFRDIGTSPDRAALVGHP
jgi:hypothetical protein